MKPKAYAYSLMWFSQLRLNINFEHCHVYTCSNHWELEDCSLRNPIKLSIVWALDTSLSNPRHQTPKSLSMELQVWANFNLRSKSEGGHSIQVRAFLGHIWCWVIALAGKFFCYNPNVAMSSRLIDPVSDSENLQELNGTWSSMV